MEKVSSDEDMDEEENSIQDSAKLSSSIISGQESLEDSALANEKR